MAVFFTTKKQASVLVSLMLLANLAVVADANAFLRRPASQNDTASMSVESERALLVELEGALGGTHRHATEKRLKRIENMLRPMFVAMTKNENGKLDSAAAGYMLHRIFVQRHGWFIKALEPAGNSHAAWSASSPVSVLEGRVGDHVQDLFEKRLGVHGLGLHELAVLASSLEHLVHVEALDRLKVAYRGAKYSQEDVLSQEEATNVMDMYMAIYVAGSVQNNLTSMTASTAQHLHSNIDKLYPNWPDTQQFLREVYGSVAPKRDYLYFNEVENVIEEVGERFGKYQDIECRQFKDWLVAVEDLSVGGAGRVRIADFYGQALNHGRWQFSESLDYLRQLGALDESDASNPRVIIPNYLSSPSNCVASSSYYSVCCIDECESILGRLEEIISAPEASPATITSLISVIPSATVPADRTLAPWLRQRLDEIAEHHGGKVPLHGRLFAQWLHYAYPRECSFPHIPGTVDPKRPEDMRAASGAEVDLSADETEMHRVVAAAPARKSRLPGAESHASEESAMWSMHEELVVRRSQPQTPVWRNFFMSVVMVGALLALLASAATSLAPALKKVEKGSSEKYYV